jgi:hypothetical protein
MTFIISYKRVLLILIKIWSVMTMIVSLIIFACAIMSQFTAKLPHSPPITILVVFILGSIAFAIWSFVRGIEAESKRAEG